MRTTLDIPEELLKEAQELLQFKSKTDTIIVSLQEFIRRRKVAALREMRGALSIDVDIKKSRRRPK